MESNPTEIKAGDILLCYSDYMEDAEGESTCGYSHVAICLSDRDVCESDASGVKITSAAALVDTYKHLAVLRGEALWTSERLKRLRGFCERKVGCRFNPTGMYKVVKRKEIQKNEEMDRIKDFFDETYAPTDHDKGSYFCSELVTSAFIDVGIIGKSASIVISSETFSPEDIGKEKVFGFFVGYIKPYGGYEVPDDDPFKTKI